MVGQPSLPMMCTSQLYIYKCATSWETCLQGLRPDKTQTGLLSYIDWLSFEILDLASICIILSRQWTTKTLIRLCGCTGWSAPLLFAYGIKQVFSWRGSNLFYSCIWRGVITYIFFICLFLRLTRRNSYRRKRERQTRRGKNKRRNLRRKRGNQQGQQLGERSREVGILF